MKQVYTLFIALLVFSSAAMAQNNGAIAACWAGGNQDSLQITFDLDSNCTAAPGSLAGMNAVGFHSGADQWASVVDWDATGAAQAMNDGSDDYIVTIEPISYYGLTALPGNIYMVFNQGPTDAATPWGSEGKDNDGNGGCQDFSIDLANLSTCTTSDMELEFAESMIVAPNPMTGSSTSLLLNNPNNETFNMTITNMMGQVVRMESNVTGDFVTIERGNLTTGIYMVVLKGENGVQISERLIIQ